jgi:hypothetical protein
VASQSAAWWAAELQATAKRPHDDEPGRPEHGHEELLENPLPRLHLVPVFLRNRAAPKVPIYDYSSLAHPAAKKATLPKHLLSFRYLHFLKSIFSSSYLRQASGGSVVALGLSRLALFHAM